MQRFSAWAVVLLLAAAPAGAAEPTFLFGAIGKQPVMLRLRFAGDQIDGWYLYFAPARQWLLSGSRGADGAFELKATASGKPIGRIAGVARGGQWTGTWSKPDGTSTAPFSAREVVGAPADLAGPIRCQSRRDVEYGWTYAPSLTLAISRGAITKFAAQLDATAKADGQSCSYSLSSFEPEATKVGLALISRGASDPPPEGERKCVIRIVGDADHLYVGFGESGDSGDDCRSGDDEMFCSARGFMAPLVVDRASRICRGVQ